MSQGLHLSQRMSLSQVLAPQLQQSLALLQAPTLELKALVEQELQQNPILEEVPAAEVEMSERTRDGGRQRRRRPGRTAADVKFDPATEKPSNAPVDDFQAEFEKLAQFDQEWRDHFSQTNLPVRQSQETEEKRQFMFDSLVAGTSLQENLLEQMRFSDLTEEQKPIAEMIIGNVMIAAISRPAWMNWPSPPTSPRKKSSRCSRSSRNFIRPASPRAILQECLMLQLQRAAAKRPSNTASFAISWRRSLSGSCPKSRAAWA
jgi:RNA polymerase sigma-54 factor